MVTTSTNGVRWRISPVLAVLIITFIVGLLDGSAAVIQSRIAPERICRYIASAIGSKEAWVGAVLHFAVALMWSALFVIAYPRMIWLRKNVWMTGPVYGVFVYVMMTFVIVPITKAPGLHFSWTGVLIHMFLVGLPIVWLTRRFTAVR